MYKLQDGEYDMLMYLYSEKYFNEECFNYYARIFSYGLKIKKMYNRGFIMLYAKRSENNHVYQLTPLALRIIHFVYNTLDGKPISKHNYYTKQLGSDKSSPNEKKMLNRIMLMNEWLVEKRKHPKSDIRPPIE
jgi:transposase-like protein